MNVTDILPNASSNSYNGGMCDMTPEVTGVTLAGTLAFVGDGPSDQGQQQEEKIRAQAPSVLGHMSPIFTGQER